MLLYRAASDICSWNSQRERRKVCSDTGKRGVYFSTYPYQALSMLLEWGRDMPVGVFQLQRDVQLPIGKYAYRNLHPERYFRGDTFLPDVPLLEDENVDHVAWNDSVDYPAQGLGPVDVEVFMTGCDVADTARLCCVYDVKKDALLPLFVRYNFTPHAPYLDAFSRLACAGAFCTQPPLYLPLRRSATASATVSAMTEGAAGASGAAGTSGDTSADAAAAAAAASSRCECMRDADAASYSLAELEAISHVAGAR